MLAKTSDPLIVCVFGTVCRCRSAACGSFCGVHSHSELSPPPAGGGDVDDKQLKTKVRRLYDIANVLASLRLVEKTQQPDTRKPAFRWKGAPAPGQPQYGGAGGAQPGGAMPAHAGGAGGNDRLQTLLLEGAESQSEPGSMAASPSPLGVHNASVVL